MKVERFHDGDDSRRLAPKVNGESYPAAMPNRSKRSVALDLKSDAGRRKPRVRVGLIGSMYLGNAMLLALNVFCIPLSRASPACRCGSSPRPSSPSARSAPTP